MGVVSRLCAFILRLTGWRLSYRQPCRKGLVILYPHTSNWDFVFGMLTIGALRLPARWAAKDTLFKGVSGRLFSALGGVPVNRRERTGFVDQMVAEFARHEDFILAMAPEGTRSRTECWKSGFYRLALAAKVPLGLGYMDYARRELGVEVWLDLSGDMATDMDCIRAAYAGHRGRRPEMMGPIRLREEVDSPS